MEHEASRWTACRDSLCDRACGVGCDTSCRVARGARAGGVIGRGGVGPAWQIAGGGHGTDELIVAIAVGVGETVGRRGEGREGGWSGHVDGSPNSMIGDNMKEDSGVQRGRMLQRMFEA